MYLDKLFTTTNPSAVTAARTLGVAYSCDVPARALPECFNWENWNGGWVGALAFSVLQELKYPIQALTKANFTKASALAYKGSSSFTRCVWEVLLDNVDLCVGDFWETAERRQLAPMTSSIAIDVFSLVSKSRVRPQTSGEFFAVIFMPFDNNVWALTVAVSLYAAICMWIVESREKSKMIEPKDYFPRPSGLMKTLYAAVMAYTGGGDSGSFWHPSAWPGRIVMMGFTFFICITVASYTASLTSFLAAPDQYIPAPIFKLSQASATNKVCMLESIQQYVMATHGIPADSIMAMDTYGPLYQMLYDGRCALGITGANEYRLFVQAESQVFPVCADPADPRGLSSCINASGPVKIVDLKNRYACYKSGAVIAPTVGVRPPCADWHKLCSIVQLEQDSEDFQGALAWALPARIELKGVVSAWIVEKKLSGTLASAFQTELIDQNVPICAGQSSAQMTDSRVLASQTLTLRDLGALYIYSVTFFAIGVAWYSVRLWQGKDKVWWKLPADFEPGCRLSYVSLRDEIRRLLQQVDSAAQQADRLAQISRSYKEHNPSLLRMLPPTSYAPLSTDAVAADTPSGSDHGGDGGRRGRDDGWQSFGPSTPASPVRSSTYAAAPRQPPPASVRALPPADADAVPTAATTSAMAVTQSGGEQEVADGALTWG